jgi:hypothetical protein
VAPALAALRPLDPACGSGAFLVHALDRLATLRRAAGDERPPHRIRRDILTGSIFGVDVNPTAVWLCELRLWLAVVIDYEEPDPLRVTPLPNLDHNVRCGDALAGGDFRCSGKASAAPVMGVLRGRYARATGARKRTLARALNREERREACAWLEARVARLAVERRGLLRAARGRDLFGGRRGTLPAERDELTALRTRAREARAHLRTVRAGGAVPFFFAAHFPDVAARGGFDVVVGNPPWVRLHRVAPDLRDRFRREFAVYRNAAWLSGARTAGISRAFAEQIDLASLFVERGMALARPGGALALLVPAKLWRSLAGGGVRRLLFERHALRLLEDWSDAPAAFDAAVYPALVVAQCMAMPRATPADELRVTTHRGRLAITWCAPLRSLPFDTSSGAPWIVIPPAARAVFDRIIRSGVALVASGLGRPMLGVKCGCNAAFLVRQRGARLGLTTVRGACGDAEIEPHLVRPVLRGESIRPWRAPVTDERIIFPHADDGSPLKPLPARARTWLLRFRGSLVRRSDARNRSAWWSLFRTESALHHRPRVVWADIGRAPEALVLPVGDRTVAINTCYVLRCRDLEDAFALTALLNSSLAAAWLGALAEPARGGYRRFLAWTVANLPIPDDWDRARKLLAPLGERGYAGHPPARADLLQAVLEAYRLRLATAAPLLEWTAR